MRETLPAGVTKEERRPEEFVIDRPDCDSRAAKGPVQVRAVERLPYRYMCSSSAYVGILICKVGTSARAYRFKQSGGVMRPQHAPGKPTRVDSFLLQLFDTVFCT